MNTYFLNTKLISEPFYHTHANRHAVDEQLLVKHAGEFSVHNLFGQQVLISKALTSAFVHCRKPSRFFSVFLAQCSQGFVSGLTSLAHIASPSAHVSGGGGGGGEGGRAGPARRQTSRSVSPQPPPLAPQIAAAPRRYGP